MQRIRLHAALWMALLGFLPVLLPGAVHAQASKDFVPQVGQEGKDVIWVPTPQSLVERMLDMAKATTRDYVIDLGSGDGRTVITAAKRGIRALGIEYNPDMVELSKRNAEKEGVAGRAQFVHGDIFQTDFSQATVLTLYLLPSLNVKLRPTILKMKPGTRVVSHAFSMDDWQADMTDNVEGRTAYLWIVPVRVEGTWRWNGGGGNHEMILKQHYQQVDGVVRLDDKMGQLRNVKINGDQIAFTIFDAANTRRDYAGKVTENGIEGTIKQATSEAKWSATRSVPTQTPAQAPAQKY